MPHDVSIGVRAGTLAAVELHALTGYHLSEAFFGRPPGGLTADAIVATLVDLVVGT